MRYTLEQLIDDCRNTLFDDPGTAGRNSLCDFVSRACLDEIFVRSHLGGKVTADRTVLYQDPDLGFIIVVHVNNSEERSDPHDHGPSWAIYGQVSGITHMQEYRKLTEPMPDKPGTVAITRSYDLKPGDVILYNEGDIHAPHTILETRLIRIEGIDLATILRDKYQIS